MSVKEKQTLMLGMTGLRNYWHQANFCVAVSFVSKQMNAGDDFEGRPGNYYSLPILSLVSFLISTGTGCSSSYDPAQFFLCFIRQSVQLCLPYKDMMADEPTPRKNLELPQCSVKDKSLHDN